MCIRDEGPFLAFYKARFKKTITWLHTTRLSLSGSLRFLLELGLMHRTSNVVTLLGLYIITVTKSHFQKENT